MLTCHEWDLNQHGRHQVHALQQFQVDVHVVWNLAAFFNLLLLWSPLMLALQQKTLIGKRRQHIQIMSHIL